MGRPITPTALPVVGLGVWVGLPADKGGKRMAAPDPLLLELQETVEALASCRPPTLVMRFALREVRWAVDTAHLLRAATGEKAEEAGLRVREGADRYPGEMAEMKRCVYWLISNPPPPWLLVHVARVLRWAIDAAYAWSETQRAT